MSLPSDSGDAIAAGPAPFPTVRVGSVPFSVASLDETVDWLLRVAGPQRLSLNVRLANAYNVALADSDPSYRALLSNQGVNFPDGTPVVWAMNARRSKLSRASHVRGPSLFAETMRRGTTFGTKHFLLGASEETLSALRDELVLRYPDLIIVGHYSPPFAPADDAFVEDCAHQISKADADIVWIGLGTPKQDLVGSALAHRLSMTTVNVGAAFDFVAGTVREAPRWIQGTGFEWLYRLASEPRRLWRRYLFGNLAFIRAIARPRG